MPSAKTSVKWGTSPRKQEARPGPSGALDAFVGSKRRTKRLNLDIPAELHTRIKVAAAQRPRVQPVMRGVQYSAIVLAACLLAAPRAHARETEIRLAWNEARTVIDHIEPRSRTHVWIGADGGTRIKGKLIAITETEVTVENRKGAISLGREQVHSIKVFPARTHAYGNRKTVAILSVPIACGSFLFTWAAVLGISDSDTLTVPKILASIGGMLVVPVAVWRLARRADRGSIRIILKDTAATSPRTEQMGEITT